MVAGAAPGVKLTPRRESAVLPGMIGWRGKALLQQVFSRVPAGERMNLLLQRYVTRSLPISDEKLRSMVDHARQHLAAVGPRLSRPLGDATFYEFGAGWELSLALALHTLGVGKQVLVDIRPLGRADLINDVIERLGLPLKIKNVGELSSYGIEYRAPCDARGTGLPDDSIDVITSTNTMEHIPPDDLDGILLECARILRPDGVASFLVDYQDHWSYFDSSLSPYHFLRYSEREWRRWNPSLHYQNRLRHRDYVGKIERAGFEILEIKTRGGSAEDLAALAQLPLDASFGGYTPAELAVQDAWITAVRARNRR
jgi:SAM-dependent methyltransferase